MAEVKMVVKGGVRYRPEHAPDDQADTDSSKTGEKTAEVAEVEHKMRTPAKAAAKRALSS